jgi:SAM-dependent methyltransferase
MASLEAAVEAMVRRGKIAEGMISLQRPELIDLFLTYQNEAEAARRFLNSSLVELHEEAEILEVGGGILALAIQLASEGFRVTTVEPVGEGFTDISFIMSIFAEVATYESSAFTLIQSPIEECKFNFKFDFIFSINVMEHLKDPYSVLLQLVNNLQAAGKYRFFCPNYDFPYEPHFGKWMFYRNKKAFYLQERRANSLPIPSDEILGLYRSLNFITLNKVSVFSDSNNIRYISNRHVFFNLLERVVNDKKLSERHGLIASIAKLVCILKLHYFAKFVPKRFQPVMDFEAYSLEK